MAASLTIQLEQSRRFVFGDVAEIEVDSVIQDDSWALWGPERNLLGVGHGPYGGGSGYGQGDSLGYGNGAYGRGLYAQGARLLMFLTLAKFIAGDYSLRSRARDALGNVGGWSAAVSHAHRPTPPAPRSLTVAAGVLGWAWSDPA